MRFTTTIALLALAFECAQAFQPNCAHSGSCRSHRTSRMELKYSKDGDEIEDDDDDENIDADSLGDWRAFRKSLLTQDEDKIENRGNQEQKRSKANEELLMKQNKALGQEYVKGVWAHEVATPEVGGLVCRLPMEAEIYRNYRHDVIGQMLRKRLDKNKDKTKKERPSTFFEDPENEIDYEAPVETSKWYKEAQQLISDQMLAIALMADDGTVDATKLSEESSALLQLFLDNQESWQEVCLVLERDESAGTATTLVLNRPMSRKLTPDLAKLLLGGMVSSRDRDESSQFRTDVTKLVMAFGNDVAVYVGGPDRQDLPAILVHGIKDLEGAEEISPGSNIYRGGLEAAVDGVLAGKYNPLDFRFFVGRHAYTESKLDLSVVLGKYQPVACARSLSLKQCIGLPKPLWHEVFELCGGTLAEISQIELLKRDDLKFEVVEDDYGTVDDDEDFYRI